ncbi:MAG: hypothetical protein GX094_00920 [Clostridiales bacterium]|nr:hypothetical protein [Clostridiales bacterium]
MTSQNIDEFLDKYDVMACSMRNSRIKAKHIAIMEVLCCTYPLKSIFILNGPLSNIRGFISFFVPKECVNVLPQYLKNLGYCDKFYILDFDNPHHTGNSSIKNINLNWKRRKFSIRLFYEQSRRVYRKQSPHNRHFKIMGWDSEIRDVYGYRGDGTERGRRALPVEDARCLVNMALPSRIKTMVDPFAGGGGIVYQAKYIDKSIEVFSVDIDETLEPGLTYYGSKHYVDNSAIIDLDAHVFDALITEVPFTLDALDDICNTLINFDKYLSSCARIVIMLSRGQFCAIEKCVTELNWHILMSCAVNRKGTDVVIMVCTKSNKLYKQMKEIIEAVKTIR